MRGHEYARAQVKAHLAATVGTRLAAIRAALSVSTPTNPAAGAYLLADALPTDPNLYPAVVVMSTGAPRIRRQSVTASGDSADFIVVYDLRVVVACRVDSAGGEEAASRDRDRLLLAVRESLLGRANLPADLEMVVGDLAEETGAAAQDLRGRPLAAGQVTFSVAVLETLAASPAPDALEESEIDMTGYGRDVDDITPN
jgi:hypothetical protein